MQSCPLPQLPEDDLARVWPARRRREGPRARRPVVHLRPDARTAEGRPERLAPRAVSATSTHWDAVHAAGVEGRSWFQAEATPSLALLDACAVAPSASVVDIGGGASPLVDALLARGHDDLTVLDVSARALDISRHRLGAQAQRVDWQVHDILEWTPARTFDVWHDRAVLHFLTTPEDRRRYAETLRAATVPESLVVVGGFAADGPEQCSGLPVHRGAVDALTAVLGHDWTTVRARDEHHQTPTGAVQHFSWVALRRRGPDEGST